MNMESKFGKPEDLGLGELKEKGAPMTIEELEEEINVDEAKLAVIESTILSLQEEIAALENTIKRMIPEYRPDLKQGVKDKKALLKVFEDNKKELQDEVNHKKRNLLALKKEVHKASKIIFSGTDKDKKLPLA